MFHYPNVILYLMSDWNRTNITIFFGQCVIGDGEVGMPVLIKHHSIIHHLDGQTLETTVKLTITTFQIKDKILQAEKHSTIELDDEVR